MSVHNPKGRREPIALHIPAEQASFLRETLESARAGARSELREFPDRLRDAGRLRCEASTYTRLLAGLEEGVIVPDAEACEAVGELARAIDRGNEYGRVRAEHDALHELLVQLVATGTPR